MDIYIQKQEVIYKQKGVMENYLKKERDKFFQDSIKGKNYFNGINSRISRVEVGEEYIILHVQGVYYEEYIKTNLFYLNEYVKKGKRDKYIELLFGEFANHLGMCGLLKTKDNKYIITKRGNKQMVGEGELSVSYSGVVEELREGKLEDNYDNVVYKEAYEELGVEGADFKEVNLVGVKVDHERGQKIELFYESTINLTENEVKERLNLAEDKDEYEWLKFVTKEELIGKNHDGVLGEMLEYIKGEQNKRSNKQ